MIGHLFSIAKRLQLGLGLYLSNPDRRKRVCEHGRDGRLAGRALFKNDSHGLVWVEERVLGGRWAVSRSASDIRLVGI
jgi:hypothetical protein